MRDEAEIYKDLLISCDLKKCSAYTGEIVETIKRTLSKPSSDDVDVTTAEAILVAAGVFAMFEHIAIVTAASDNDVVDVAKYQRLHAFATHFGSTLVTQMRGEHYESIVERPDHAGPNKPTTH